LRRGELTEVGGIGKKNQLKNAKLIQEGTDKKEKPGVAYFKSKG